MTENEINNAIARQCGWVPEVPTPWMAELNKSFYTRGSETRMGCPPYARDLNAMHEAEKLLTETQLREYDKWLESRRFAIALETYAWHAAAAQRAEAFLRAIGKWTDSKDRACIQT